MLRMILIFCFGSSIAMADLSFESGYNVFDETSGYHVEVGVGNDAHLDVFGGEIGGVLGFWESSTGNIYGGDISYLRVGDDALVNVYGGNIEEMGCFADSVVELYAYNVTHHLTGGGDSGTLEWMEGQYLLDNSYFSFDLYHWTSFPHINVVPEPATILLLAFGGLFLRRKS